MVVVNTKSEESHKQLFAQYGMAPPRGRVLQLDLQPKTRKYGDFNIYLELNVMILVAKQLN